MTLPYKLTYFNVTGLGEPIRFLFTYGNIEFEDSRIDDFEEWKNKIKPTMPFGQMPILEYESKVAHQSLAIARYVAKKVELVGKNDWEDLEIDAAVDTLNDLKIKLSSFHYESDENIKKSKMELVLKEQLPYYLKKLNDQAEKNGGHLACNRLTWADMYLAGIAKYFNYVAQKDIFADAPALKKVCDYVYNLPSIKAWMNKSPKTLF
ncbi:unnamed protein product [Acanthoscelides obtectus]|uniref:glutathione transferase n=1 Tax=Acanthoscelides obtectus TaxID=200917 RepID=A0A9P0KT78_ACAOB|nr:unnamed protein product [Acanthoscelides obtectus]CAK1631959.1 hypothetical protein AOBTE_LOCUS7256 [Acanthoscelides obtectus]